MSLLTSASESPRWLIARGQNDKALHALERIRPKRDAQDGLCSSEVAILEEAIEQAKLTGTGSWLDLFRGTHLRRTIVSGG